MIQQNIFNEEIKEHSGAIFSDCRKYRYALYREWDITKGLILFIGLNPSTANETTNDATIRKVIKFAKRWGYGGIYMMNLFAFVSTDPKKLLSCEDPVGDNDKYLIEARGKCNDVLFAWGNFEVNGRDKVVSAMFENATCLGLNKNGSPKHPLYIPDKTNQINYK